MKETPLTTVASLALCGLSCVKLGNDMLLSHWIPLDSYTLHAQGQSLSRSFMMIQTGIGLAPLWMVNCLLFL